MMILDEPGFICVRVTWDLSLRGYNRAGWGRSLRHVRPMHAAAIGQVKFYSTGLPFSYLHWSSLSLLSNSTLVFLSICVLMSLNASVVAGKMPAPALH